ncbi:MAG: hypothetical protein ACFFG0_33360, partial [Candidatus Thorarchaeota archaeon]
IITSWWDFGHWFKAIADRAVTFDGGSQNRPQAHWVGKLLLTNNEEESVAILRMLDCGGNDAYDLLLEETNDPLETKKIIDEVIMEDKDTARNTLLSYTENPDKILEKTHCNPPDSYLITSEDMVGKGGVWAHFGSWSFNNSFAYNTVKSNSKNGAIEVLKEKLGYSEEEATKIYDELKGLNERQANQWIAPYPSYSGVGNCQTQNNTVYCSNGAIIDLTNKEAMIRTNQGEAKIKNFRIDNEIFTDEGDEGISILYISDKSISVLMDPKLLDSLFTELFYLEGKYVENFELFDYQRGIDGFEIYVWKTKWQ